MIELKDSETIILGTIIVLFLFYIIYIKCNEHYVRSPIDGKIYNVKKFENSEEAANMLANVNKNVTILLKHLKNRYGKEHPVVKNLLNRFDPDVINEHIPTFLDSQVAYTNNKGQSLNLCLRTMYSDSNDIHKINIIMFVALHELSHIGTDVKQHPPEFWQTFKFILKEAVDVGIYIPIDYSKHPTIYCDDMVVDYNPYYDIALDSYVSPQMIKVKKAI